MQDLLKNVGLKKTLARTAILGILRNSKIPLSVESIYKELKKEKKNKGINEVTIYRTLSSFEEANLVKKVDFRKESMFFELVGGHHHHIVCTNCDNVEDFQNREVEKALEVIVKKSSKFKIIREHSLELFGLCTKCA